MTITVKNIIPFKVAEAALTQQYQAVNCKTVIDKFTATNNTAGNVTLSIYVIPPSGTADPSNLVINSRAVAPNETYTFPGVVGHVVETSGAIVTIASATGLTIGASGREITA